MVKSEKPSFDQLLDAVRISSIQDLEAHRDIFNALLTNLFKESRVKREPYFGQDTIYGVELLTYWDEQSPSQASMQRISDQANMLDISSQLDLLIIKNIIDRTKPEDFQHPTGVNVAPKSLLSGRFEAEILPNFPDITGHTLIVEILEQPIKPDTDIKTLHSLREKGIAFALDDYLSPNGAANNCELKQMRRMHETRLDVFGSVLDFVKLDGAVITPALNDPQALEELERLVEHLKTTYPGIKLIAEHVPDFEQADRLYAIGIDAAQGRFLEHPDYPQYRPHLTQGDAASEEKPETDGISDFTLVQS